MADIHQALAMLTSTLPDPGRETVHLHAAEGRVLADPVIAGESAPPFARAAMDGYAVLSSDVQAASPSRPIELLIVGDTAPGHPFPGQVTSGQAVAISTGAPIPTGADAVVRQEDARLSAGGRVRVLQPVAAGRHISRAGEDLPAGALALTSGAVIGPLELGLLSMLGETHVQAYRRPRVSILCTGDELVEPHQDPAYGQVRNVNGPALVALVRQAGGIAEYLGTVPDHPAAIAARLSTAPASDLLLTTGGVSRGSPDKVAEAAGLLGATVLLKRLEQKPGAACLGAIWGGRVWIGLSGNPAAAFTQFDFLVRPLIAHAAGRTDTLLQPVLAELAGPADKPCPVRRYLRAQLSWRDHRLLADPALAQQASVLSSLVQANGYIDLNPTDCPVTGDTVQCWVRPGALPAPVGVLAPRR